MFDKKKMQNNHSLGIIYNNMGHIHMKHNRYIESIECYRHAVTKAEIELLELLHTDSLEAFYLVKPLNGWD